MASENPDRDCFNESIRPVPNIRKSSSSSIAPPVPFKFKTHILYHIPDYILFILFASAFATLALTGAPFERIEFRIDDPDIGYLHRNADIVPMSFIGVFFFLIPILLVAIVCILWKFQRMTKVVKKPKAGISDLQYALLNDPIHHFQIFLKCIMFSGVFTLLITEILKQYVGRLRPDFLDRCKPQGWGTDINKAIQTIPPQILTCTGDPELIREGRLSFPSGHSSSTAAGAWIFNIMLYSRRSFVMSDCFTSIALRSIVALFPLMSAATVGLSRLQQRVHNPTDVIFGFFIGAVVSSFFFYHYFGNGLDNDEIRRSSDGVDPERQHLQD